MGACARNMYSDPAEIKPAQCCIKLVFHLTWIYSTFSYKFPVTRTLYITLMSVCVITCDTVSTGGHAGPFSSFARHQIKHVPVPCCPARLYNTNNISTWFMKITQERKVTVLLPLFTITRILTSQMLRPILFHHRRHSWQGSWWSPTEAVFLLPVGNSWPNKCSDVPRAGVKNEWSRASTHKYALTAWWETSYPFFALVTTLPCVFSTRVQILFSKTNAMSVFFLI